MEITQKQVELAYSVPAIVGLLPAKRRALVSAAGREAAFAIVKSGLTIREQQAALAVADLFLQYCHEDSDNRKWSELMEEMIRLEEAE
ncbi:MAG TPA: hypothetical protein PKA10_08200 [Selenomonadales bacterium]|nr:hypothetical protein [Selenomonadales bacterium]